MRVQRIKVTMFNEIRPDFPSLAVEVTEPRPDTNIKFASFTLTKKFYNTYYIRNCRSPPSLDLSKCIDYTDLLLNFHLFYKNCNSTIEANHNILTILGIADLLLALICLSVLTTLTSCSISIFSTRTATAQ